jgi:ATP-dependent DNA ligase
MEDPAGPLATHSASRFRPSIRAHAGRPPARRTSDLLRRDGDDLRPWPIEARREALMRLVAKRRSDGILFSEALAVEGAVVFAKACELGFEGIVSKRAGSVYRSGASKSWLKTKNPDFVRT